MYQQQKSTQAGVNHRYLTPHRLPADWMQYAGVIWQVMPTNAVRAETDWIPLTSIGCISLRHQRVMRFDENRQPAPTDASPVWILGGRLDGYTVRFDRHMRVYELSHGPYPEFQREVSQLNTLVKAIRAAAKKPFYAAMPEFPEFYFAPRGKIDPQLHSNALREDAATRHNVQPADVTAEQLDETWHAARQRIYDRNVWPQRYFLGAATVVPVEVWCNVAGLLGCELDNQAWAALRNEQFVTGQLCQSTEIAAERVECWQNGVRTVLAEHGLLPISPEQKADPEWKQLRPQDVAQLQANLLKYPEKAALAWADYLEMQGVLLPQQAASQNWGKMIERCRAGEVPKDFMELRTMPSFVCDPRQPDHRLQQVMTQLRARYRHLGAALMDSDLIAAIREPRKSLVASRIARPFVYRHLGVPSPETMCFQLPGLYCDLFSAPPHQTELYAPTMAAPCFTGGHCDSSRNADPAGDRLA